MNIRNRFGKSTLFRQQKNCSISCVNWTENLYLCPIVRAKSSLIRIDGAKAIHGIRVNNQGSMCCELTMVIFPNAVPAAYGLIKILHRQRPLFGNSERKRRRSGILMTMLSSSQKLHFRLSIYRTEATPYERIQDRPLPPSGRSTGE